MNLEKLEKIIYNKQKVYEKRYKIDYVDQNLHIWKLYLHNLLKELKEKTPSNKLEYVKFLLKVFNEWSCYRINDAFIQAL